MDAANCTAFLHRFMSTQDWRMACTSPPAPQPDPRVHTEMFHTDQHRCRQKWGWQRHTHFWVGEGEMEVGQDWAGRIDSLPPLYLILHSGPGGITAQVRIGSVSKGVKSPCQASRMLHQLIPIGCLHTISHAKYLLEKSEDSVWISQKSVWFCSTFHVHYSRPWHMERNQVAYTIKAK